MKGAYFKIIVFFLSVSLFFTNCSEEEEVDIMFTISQNEVTFPVMGGEQTVEIKSTTNWDCAYDADWLLVRQQQDRIRIIADANGTDESRTAVVTVFCEDVVMAEVAVMQEGTIFSIEQPVLLAESSGGIFSIPISCNVEWSIENDLEWCKVEKNNSSLDVSISRNYNMEERSGSINIAVGENIHEVVITQSASQWFESFELIDIEGGTFYMGAQKDDESGIGYDLQAYQIEYPVHQVTLNSYAIGKYEVTQAQWEAAMGYNPSTNIGKQNPVEGVTWEQVQDFIALLKEKTGLHYRLPTEAEWEYAAKGGKLNEGFKYSGYSVLGACGWYYSNSESKTHEVGSKSPNGLGIYDMSGNVREWCNDWFDYYTYTDVDNPQGPDYGDMKVNRGGSWTTPAVNCRNTYRHTDSPNEASQDLGFRLALSIK